MKIWLLRHGRTAWNAARRYQGQTDIPLSDEGRAALRPLPHGPERVYVSPLRRARETAALLFPTARQVAVKDLTEMDFGVFEGRTADEMERDPAFRAWVAGNCEGRCPGGESRGEFCERTCSAFASLLEKEREELVVVAHGGTVCAVLERFGLPESDYFSWRPENACGWALDYEPELWRARRRLRVSGELCLARKGAPC